jgi:hypothetical protein
VAKKANLKKLHENIAELLKGNPAGLTIHEIRKALPADIGPQEQLDRRVRDLRSKYDIVWEKGSYILKGKKAKPTDSSGISGRLRAAVIHKAHGRCQMCGRTVADDSIKLEADHKVPRTWGGLTVEENLQAICQQCNNGKRDYFASFDPKEMRKIVKLESVHARLAEMLRLRRGKAVPSWLLEFIANVDDFQEDWHRRLRELRSLGIEYKYKRTRLPSGKVETTYILTKWKPLPPDHQLEIRRRERNRRSV